MKKLLIAFLISSTLTYGAVETYAQSSDEFNNIPKLSLPNDNELKGIKTKNNSIYSPDALLYLNIGAENSVYFNNNIYRSKNNEKGSLINVFSPNMSMRSDMDKHYIGADLNLKVGTYLANSKNNYTDANFRTRARFDLSSDDAINIGGSFKFNHVAIGSFVDTPNSQTVEETKYRYSDAYIGLVGLLNQANITYDTGIISSLYDYNNVRRINGTLNINDDRDRIEHMIHAKIGYNLTPNTNIYTGTSYNVKNYTHRIDTSALFTRNSNGYNPILGIKYDNKKLNYGFDIQAGYLNQNYNAVELNNSKIITTNITGHFNPINNLTLKGNFTRNLKESNSTGVSSYVQTRTSVYSAYKINNKWKSSAKFRYTNNDFNTNTSLKSLSRNDNLYNANLWLDYNISSKYSLRGGYEYVKRKSNDTTAEYKNNIFSIRLKIKY